MDYTGPHVTESSEAQLAETKNTMLLAAFCRLRPNVVLREEGDHGGFLFDPDSDVTTVINRCGTALLKWRPERINYGEWCAMMQSRYKEISPERIAKDIEGFLKVISYFLEPADAQ